MDRAQVSSDEASPTSSSSSVARPDTPLPRANAWEAAVRMRVLGANQVGYGSGTIIGSTADESIVLTAAHYFTALEDAASGKGLINTPSATETNASNTHSQAERPFDIEDYYKQLFENPLVTRSGPWKVPFKIMIDLFNGEVSKDSPPRFQFRESVAGELVDFEFDRDIALVRIKPGRRLAAARFVPAHWQPKKHMQMLSVGCSEGSDPTVQRTMIIATCSTPMAANPAFEAIECRGAPKQGRSGGGLCTEDGYLAGVCNFAASSAGSGYYATPASIYRLLDKNKLSHVYESESTPISSRRPDSPAVSRRQENDQAYEARRAPELIDHERRLRDLEQKLERLIDVLERAGDKPKQVR
jgi:hypothetical protein